MYHDSQRMRGMTDVAGAVSRRSLVARLCALKSHLVALFETAADYNRAAALYEKLSLLNDAELRNRGLNRASLGWDLCEACDRTNRRHRHIAY
jgi:hypothetical protein